MKKLLVLAALTMAAAPAMASKARLTALGNSEQLKDAQTVFTRPSDLTGLGNWATAELGATPSLAANGASGAEGGFARSYGEGYLGFYMGHRGVATSTRSAVGGATVLAEENPLEVYYASKAGELVWGASVYFSKSDKKAGVTGFAAGSKASSMGVRGSVETGAIDAYVHVGITDTAEVGTNKYKGGTPITLGAGYVMGNGYIFAEVATIDAKVDSGTGDQKFKGSDYKVGYISTTKSEGSNFFWGVAYQGHNRGGDIGAVGGEASTELPFWIGVEQEANSWLTVRASVKQNTILGGYKVGEVNTTDNNTSAAAGVGLKFNKLVLDGAIATANGTAGNQGDIVGDNLLTNVALTYMF